MGINDMLKNKREEILRVAARHGASNVRIFGSPRNLPLRTAPIDDTATWISGCLAREISESECFYPRSAGNGSIMRLALSRYPIVRIL